MRGQDCLHVKKKKKKESIFFLKKLHNSKLPKRNNILAIVDTLEMEESAKSDYYYF